MALSAVFTFVARKRDGSGVTSCHLYPRRLRQEQRLFADAAKIQAQRKAQRQAAKDPSKQAESAAARDEQIEALLKPGRIARDFPGQADEGFVLMHETSLKNAITTQPQVRNTAGRVFGGALMRYALELAPRRHMHFRGAAPASFTGAFDPRIRPETVRRRVDGVSRRCARSDDAVHRASRLRAARRGRRAPRAEEPRRPRLRPRAASASTSRPRCGSRASASHADEQLLVCF